MFQFFNKDSTSKPLRDPVCGMRAGEGITAEYKGQTYGFCSEHCKHQFEKNPENYIQE